MILKNNLIENDGLSLEYFIFGNGPQKVLCLHGHGRSAQDFEFLQNKERTVISINLFFHGKSVINQDVFKGEYITEIDVHNLLKKILAEEEITSFHWVAFSQGGRFVLSTILLFQNQIESISLFAPDGLNNRNFYSWTQRRCWARKLFKRWTTRPEEMLNATKLLRKLRIISPELVKFIESFSSNPEKLRKAFASWILFRKLIPNPKLIGVILKKNKIPIRLIIGKYDKIIQLKSAQAFIKKSKLKDSLVIVESGHDFFKENKISKYHHLILINED